MASAAQSLEEMNWFNEPQQWEIKGNAWMQDNTPIQVGPMAASPDGEGFKVRFESFKVTHLPDQRRTEWLKKNQ